MSRFLRRTLRRTSLLIPSVIAACGSAPPLPIQSVRMAALDTSPNDEPVREPPPAPGPRKPYRFPPVVWAELRNGLRVATITRKGLPVVELRVVVGAGRAADGEKPGLAALTARLLEDGGAGSMSSREIVTRIASLGAELSIETGFDATKLGMAVASDRLAEAVDLLGAIVQRPQLSGRELEKLKKREADDLADAARTRGTWGASMVLFKDLFALPSEQHPYAAWSATASEVARLTAADCRAFHKREYVPKNTIVVVAGDTTPEVAKALVQKAFGAHVAAEAPLISFADPTPPDHRRITIVDRPKSLESDVFVGSLGPARSDDSFAAFAVASQILGGGVAGGSSSTRSTVTELAHGPSVLLAYAGTPTAKTGLAVEALLEKLDAIGQRAPDADEVEAADRLLADGLPRSLETVGAIADELARLHALGLPDDEDDDYEKQIGEVTAPLVLKVASEHVRAGHEVVVVAGDAAVIGPMLSRFGEVKVLDATRDFARVRTIPMDAR